MRVLVPVVLALNLTAACTSKTPAPQVLSADLSFWFKCANHSTLSLEGPIESFLKSRGFGVLNIGAIQRAKGAVVFDLNITAIDDQHRLVDFLAFSTNPGKQVVTLRSEPPTRHDDQLESALLQFSSAELGCAVSQTKRGENNEAARDLFEWEVHRVEGLFKEAQLSTNGA